ncbi:MAG: hypothetical protein EXX96DRAFT_586578 [Benjaminiella poitrasii]|nr:MAG: hypothetical protein EXX96DRAFT_586578 [Benjaminiella poitrasii]
MKDKFSAYNEVTIEHYIIGYLYLERMLSMSHQDLTEYNWEILISVTMLATVKYWDDHSLYTKEFAPFFGGLTIDVVLNIERTFFNDISFNLLVKCSEFAETYFRLRKWM